MRLRLTLFMLLFVTGINLTSISAQDDIVTLDLNDILDRIAQSFDVSVACLEQSNNLDRFPSTGELSVDTTCPPYDETTATETLADAVTNAGQGGAIQNYTVESGDRLADIAETFGVTVSCIQSANNITNADLIFVGQILTITQTCQPASTVTTTTTSTTSATNAEACAGDANSGRVLDGSIYIVQSGDILDFIGCDLNMDTACLIDINNLTDRREPLLAGQRLVIDERCTGWTGPYNAGSFNG